MHYTARAPRRSRRGWRVLLSACAAALAVAATAVATDFSDHYLQGQGMSAGNSYAWSVAHNNTYYVETVSDHTACPAYDQGHSGYFSGAPADFVLSICGPGTSGWSHGNSGAWRGAAFNPNSATFDNFSDAHVSWHG
ncbi:MAG: hypothetical protein JWR63_1786 [Conexibacter sp.]|nr:hypothetical protein [Conexibacter sp.]